MAVCSFGVLLFSAPARAQLTWNDAGPTNNWSTADANWLPGNVVWTQNSSAIFGGTTGETVTVTTANIFDNATFNSTSYTIADGAGTLALANDLASTITVTTAGQIATFSETLTNNAGGASALTKAGAGTLNLTNTANSYSGGFTISAGVVNAGSAGVSGVGTLGLGAVSIGSGASLMLNSVNNGNVTYSNAFSGAGALSLSTAGGVATNSSSLVLNGNVSGFTGTMNITGGGKVQLNASSGAPSTSATVNVATNGTLYVVGGITVGSAVTLNGGDTGESLGQLRVEFGSTFSGNVTLAGNITGGGDAFVGSNSGIGTLSGIIGESGGSRTLSKTGNATIVLTGANTYTGGTTILNGALQVGSGGTTGTLGSGAIANGGALIYNRSDTVTLDSAIGGSGTLSKQGAGNLTLTGTNTYTGTTTISAGILQVGNGGTSGTLGTGAIVNNGTLAISRSDAVTIGNAISGSGIFATQGNVTVTGANTSTGATYVTAGTLQVGNGGTTGTLASGAISNNGTLAFNRSDAVTLTSAISGSGNLNQLGASTLTLSGVNAIRTLNVNNAGGTVDIGAGNLTISNGGGSGLQGVGGTVNATGGGQIVLGSGAVGNGLDFGASNGATLTINAVVTGAQGLDFFNTPNGNGVVVLNGANSYTGATSIQTGVVSVSSLGNTGSNGNLGTSATINLGAANFSSATLRYTGTGETTNRVINLLSAGSGQTLEQSGASGNLKFTSNLGTSANSTTLKLQGSTAGTGELAGVISDNAAANITSLAKSGTGTWTLSGTNTYTGTTVVSAGTLAVSGNISSSAALNVAGGTLLLSATNAVNNTSAGLTLGFSGSSTSGTLKLAGDNLSESFGALTLSYNSTLDFGTGAGGQELLFTSVGAHTAGSTLSILNWSGTAGQLGDTTTDRLLFTGNATDFTSKYAQSDVSFGGYPSGYQTISYSGGYEVAAVPEPATTALFSALALVGMIAVRERRKLWQTLAGSRT